MEYLDFNKLKQMLQRTNPDIVVTDEHVQQISDYLLKLYSVVV